MMVFSIPHFTYIYIYWYFRSFSLSLAKVPTTQKNFLLFASNQFAVENSFNVRRILLVSTVDGTIYDIDRFLRENIWANDNIGGALVKSSQNVFNGEPVSSI